MFSKGNEPRGNEMDADFIERGESAKPAGIPSILGSDIKITGDLFSDGDIQIDGVIVGDIKARTLTFGQSADVEGVVSAEDVRVGGRIAGKVMADHVALMKGASVTGSIVHQTLTVEPGAIFEGQVERRKGTAT